MKEEEEGADKVLSSILWDIKEQKNFNKQK